MQGRASASGPDQALRAAADQFSRGQLDAAERTLQDLLRRQPDQGDALNLLSVIANTKGRGEEAVGLAASALALDERRPDFHFTHGRALKALRRLDEAVSAYERALQLRPDFAEVLVSLGIVLRLLGRHDEAIERYRQALRIRPDFPEALGNLGNALAERIGRDLSGRLTAEDLREAEHVQRRALDLAPRDPNMLHNLGIVLRLSGRYDEALTLFDRALGIDRSRVDTCLQLGDLLYKELRFDVVKRLLTRWLLDNEPNVEVMRQLAMALTEMGEGDEALAWLDRAAALRAESPEAMHLRGRVMQGQFGANEDAQHALAIFRASLESRPDYFEAICSYLLTLCYVEEDPVKLFEEHRTRLLPVGQPAAPLEPRAVADSARSLRIGYVSYDFRRHSVAYFLENILESHDRSRFEIHGYMTNAASDATTHRLRQHFDHWVECAHLSDAQLCDRVRADGIDILIDLSGLTSGGRLGAFNRRAAPCQITYLGYPTTTGAACFDFRITDPVIDPPGSEGWSSEPLLRCPQSMFCYRPDALPDVRPSPAIETGQITFGSFNNLSKVGPHVLDLWQKVLVAVPRSRLLLKAQGLSRHANREHIWQYFASHGIERERIVLQSWDPDLEAHLSAYGAVDVGLDTFPFNGATTTCEALAMGVPVVTLAGRTHPSRMGASILSAVGLPELVAHDEDGYVANAVALARDLPRLSALRAGMRERLRKSRLLDKDGFTRDFDALLEAAFMRTARARQDEQVE